MKTRFSFLIFILFTFGSSVSLAEKYRRLVTFEWEQIEGALGYEVEVTKKIKDKEKLYQLKTNKPSWEGKLTPGRYYIKIRAFDSREVPGEWSEPQPLQVNLDNVQIQNIRAEEQIQTNEDEKKEIQLKWNAVQMADEYVLSIKDKAGKTVFETVTANQSHQARLSVAENYTLHIQAKNKLEQYSDATTVLPFTLIAKQLEKPLLEKPKNDFVREVKWAPVSFAENYNYEIQRYDPKSRSWKKIMDGTVDKAQLDIDSTFQGGTYSVKMQAQAKLRKSSQVNEMKFKIRSGDRSPASEFNSLVRQSIDRVSKWYALFSYLVTQINYSSSYFDTAGLTNYGGIGATLRMGLGYDTGKTDWGYLGIIDYSGFQSDSDGVLTYMSAELSGVFKKQFRDRDEGRIHLGIFMRELPATLADGRTGAYSESKISSMGPHIGAEYWYALTPKWGAQANAHIYSNMLKISTPNGASINPSHSLQLGVLASYRYSNRLTYLFGYTRREDKIRYGQSDTKICSSAACNGENRVEVQGNYLNFYAEYDF